MFPEDIPTAAPKVDKSASLMQSQRIDTDSTGSFGWLSGSEDMVEQLQRDTGSSMINVAVEHDGHLQDHRDAAADGAKRTNAVSAAELSSDYKGTTGPKDDNAHVDASKYFKHVFEIVKFSMT